MNLANISAIVTGGGGAIGQAISLELARQGAQVVCVDLDPIGLAQTVQQIKNEGGKAFGIRTDVTAQNQVKSMVAETIDALGQVDVLVNNAAIFRAIGGVWEVDPDEWWLDVKTNLLGPFLCCRAVLPQMMKQNRGIIINMSGGGFGGPVLGGSGYSCSKTALIRLTDTLAFEIGEKDSGHRIPGMGYNIQVYAMEPAFVLGPMNEFVAQHEQGQNWLPFVKKDLELGKVQPPEDVGRAICRLIEISHPALSGRVFSYRQDLEHLSSRIDEIKTKDLHQLRMRFN
jgi:NAD(P)-dependent dehydrogenase (short-subunit alcohol dehydrogenase family)